MKMNKKTLWTTLLLSVVLVALIVALGIFASAEDEYVLYISNTGAGLKDGSSPENAMGQDATFYTDLAKAIEISKIREANRTPEQKAFCVSVFERHVFFRALNDPELKSKGGKVVVVGELTLEMTEWMRQDTMNEFRWPVGSKNITFTSVHNGVDYRKQGAKFTFDVRNTCINLDMKAPTTWEKLNIEHLYNSATCPGAERALLFSGNCNEMIFGEGLEVVATDVNSANVKVYPTIVGGHRYIDRKKDSNITIKSGTWGSVFAANFGIASQGNFTGNTNVTVDGGTINLISGGHKDTNTAGPFLLIGNANITINGGTVKKIYGTHHNGINGKINVVINDGAKVTEAYSYQITNNNADKKPTDATITYASSSILKDNVKDFTTATMVGDPALQPDPFRVIFIANEAKGTGDGSSPENAMGQDAKYYEDLAKAIEISKSGTTNRTPEQKAFFLDLMHRHVLYRALNDSELLALGGKIVVVDELTLDITDTMRNDTMLEFFWPSTTTKNITFTSVYRGVDYRTQGAKFIFDVRYTCLNFDMKAPTTWENITIEHLYNSKTCTGAERAAMFSTNCNKTVFGEGIEVVATDVNTTKTKMYPTIIGGHRYVDRKANSDITIKSGTWGSVFAANFGIASQGNFTGNTNVTVDGGTINLISGGHKDTYTNGPFLLKGNANITINGGKVNKIYGTHHNGIEGKINVVINDGAKVTEAYGFQYTGKNDDKQPANATITYASSSILKDNVKYFTTATMVGDPALQPDPFRVIFIANEAKGTGDGSSAENAMGQDANFYADLEKVIEISKIKDANRTQEQRDLCRDLFQRHVLYRALSDEDLKSLGGQIVIVGELSVQITEWMRQDSMNEWLWPMSTKKNITFTSVYRGVDYRAQGAKITFDVRNTCINFDMNAPTTWENLTIEHLYNSKTCSNAERAMIFSGNCNKMVFGEGLEVIATDVNTPKVKVYPTIVGGHRYLDRKTDSNITIKSGTWGNVFAANFGIASQGNFTANTNVTIDGGTVNFLSGAHKDTNTAGPYLMKGNVNITINGGLVKKLYASHHNGAEGKITVVVNDGARVNEAWGFQYTGKNLDKQPTDATITYASSSIRKENVKYFTTATMVGDPSLQPEIEYYTLYIANQAKGKGDGSSPENAMGQDATYYADLAKAIEISKLKAADRTDEHKAFCTSLMKRHVLYRALSDSELLASGGKIVVVGELTLDITDSMRNDTMLEFLWPAAGKGEIIFTSVDKGVDYRAQGAKFIFDVRYTCINFDMKAPTTWENITIEHLYNSKTCTGAERAAMFSANCNETVFGEGIEVIATDEDTRNIKLYPTIIGGHRYADLKKNSDITIKSGTWGSVFGANFGVASTGHFTGNTNVTVDGGVITILSGGSKNTNVAGPFTLNGNVNVTINGGTVRKLFGTHHLGLAGEGHKVNVVINEGASVGKAWGFQFTDKLADKQPEAYITYASSAIRTENIQYFTEAKMVGDPSLQPEESYYTIYIADKPRGTGDGTSPENAMGNDSDYAALCKKAYQYAKIDAKKRTQEQKDIIANTYKKSALYKASMDPTLTAIGGKIVLVDKVTIDSNTLFTKSLGDYDLTGNSDERIIITSKDNGVDYRKKGARLILDVRNTYICLTMNAPTLWEYITIEHKYNSDNGATIESGAMIAGNGKPIEMGYGVYTYNTDVGKKPKENYPSIIGGNRWRNLVSDTSVTVRSGNWAQVIGGDFGTTTTGKVEGNVDILITGGKIARVIGTNKAHTTNHKETVHGNVRIRVWGGEVEIIYGTNNNGLKKGYVSVSLGKGAKVKQAYGYHPNYKGKAKVYAYIYYHPDAIAKNKIYNFIQATPQTSTSIVFFVGVAALTGAGALAVGSKSKKRKIK